MFLRMLFLALFKQINGSINSGDATGHTSWEEVNNNL